VADWLLVDEQNPRAREAGQALRAHLDGFVPPDGLSVVVGGDGFLLRSVAASDFQGQFLGLNAGNLGFLHNDVVSWEAAASALKRGEYRVLPFPLLEAKVQLADGGERTVRAMNELYLERSTGQAARLAVTIDDIQVVDNLVCDGLIVATALGSTAYSFSAGGAPAHPLLHLLKITPICPHRPRLTPFDLPPVARVHISVQVGEYRPVRAVVDGAALDEVRSVEVGLCDQRVNLGYFFDHDFTGHLLRKIVIP
jgi:NAD+ kinase